MELKFLAMLMNEAVRLGHADGNPLTKMDIQKDDPEEKPEMTDEEISRIRAALEKEPEWMQTCFDIALHTGCRLRETRLPLTCISFSEKKITFPHPKGGRHRAFSIPMPTALFPLLKRLKGRLKGLDSKYTLEFPYQPSRRWQQFFMKLKLEHLWFHCLRVTFINRLRRARVPMQDAMRLVNHASELIHKIYQREKVEDVEQWRDVVQFPAHRIEEE